MDTPWSQLFTVVNNPPIKSFILPVIWLKCVWQFNEYLSTKN